MVFTIYPVAGIGDIFANVDIDTVSVNEASCKLSKVPDVMCDPELPMALFFSSGGENLLVNSH